MILLEAFARYGTLSDEQRVLVGGRGADARQLDAWRWLLEDIGSYEHVRARAQKQALVGVVGLAVLTGACLALGLRPPFDLDETGYWLWGAALGGALWAALVGVFVLLRRRAVERPLSSTVLPFLRALEEELGPERPLFLSLRLDGARAERGNDVRWLDGAVELADESLLHFGARDVAEPSGLRTWMRATWSRPTDELHPLALEGNDPTVSGLTRTVADEARRGGNPFTSGEMVALREAHGVQVQLLQLEAFEQQRTPPPPVGDVLGEASRGVEGGREHDDVNAAVLLELSRAARQPAS